MINPWLAFLAAGLLGGLYALAFLGFKLKLTRLGSALWTLTKSVLWPLARFLVG